MAPRQPCSAPIWPPRSGTSSLIRASSAGWWDTLRITLEIVRNPAGQRGFAVYPRRWVVERTLAWLTANRRLARDYERHPEVSEGIIRWAAIAGTARRITRGQPAQRQPRRTFDWN